MSKILCPLSLLLVASLPLSAQLVTRRPFIRASGDGVVSIRPDQVQLSMGVTTQATTAAAAGDENATRVNAVLAAARQVLGPNADIRTINYSVSPVYRNTQPPQNPPQIIAYQVNNSLLATTPDLGSVGKLIDAVTQAGATNIGGLQFSLRDSGPAQAQALRSAVQQARSQVEAIAVGLGVRLGQIVSVEESSAARPTVLGVAAGAARAPTPVEVGNLQVSASVVLEAEIAVQ